MIFIESDASTNKACKYHCCPSCHPAQVGPETVYGCKHKAWPCNRAGDFVPIVDCGGNPAECEIPVNIINRVIAGLNTRRNNLVKKDMKLAAEISELIEISKAVDKKQRGKI